MKRNEHELFNRSTQAIIYNYQTAAVQRMLDFDFACRRETPSVAAIVNPGKPGVHKCFWGTKEILIPVYSDIATASEKQPQADVLINFASFRSAFQSSVEALAEESIRTIVIIAEGVPESRAKQLIALAEASNKIIIGPATVGGIKPGCFRIGNTAGPVENIVESNLHQAGFVGFVSKSGGMSNEMYNMLSMVCQDDIDSGDRVPALYEGISIGGDRFPGSRLIDHLLRFEQDPNVKMLVALGEVGGDDEYQIVRALEERALTKPLVIWVVGTCATLFPGEAQFGHAGARAEDASETAEEKNNALRMAGAIVPYSFDDFGEVIQETFLKLRNNGSIPPIERVEAQRVPVDLKKAEALGTIRRPTSFVSTIADDRGEELTYNGIPISQVIEKGIGIGGTIGQLWFQRELPKEACQFLETVLILTADHGPAVSGAHNAIVAARAGKDLVSSVASGMLTIGPRFGGAIDDSARHFKNACDSQMSPSEFIDSMKQQATPIPGIGHRVKSIHNPDKRVQLLKEFALANFKSNSYLQYALEVEALTTKKKANLILNVDGCVAVCFLDMLASVGDFSSKEIEEIVELGALNGLFVVGRCIGMVGHVLDQRRLKQPLYRHPWEDIAYLKAGNQ